MARIFVTGGAGFIGSHTVRALVDRGHELVACDAFHHHSAFGTPTFAENVAYRMETLLNGAELLRANISSTSTLRRQLTLLEPEYIVHLASVSSAETVAVDPEGTFESIVRTTAGLLDICRELGSLRKIVYVSSSMVYGDFIDVPTREDAPKNPVELYGGFKLIAEMLVKTYGRRYGLPFSIVRPAAVYGPGNNNRSILQRLVESAVTGEAVAVINPSETHLDFTFVRDLAEGLALVTLSSDAEGQDFNVSCGEGRTLADAVAILGAESDYLNVEIGTEDTTVRPMRGALDITKARRLVGYAPQCNLEDGLREYLSFALHHNPSLHVDNPVQLPSAVGR